MRTCPCLLSPTHTPLSPSIHVPTPIHKIGLNAFHEVRDYAKRTTTQNGRARRRLVVKAKCEVCRDCLKRNTTCKLLGLLCVFHVTSHVLTRLRLQVGFF